MPLWQQFVDMALWQQVVTLYTLVGLPVSVGVGVGLGKAIARNDEQTALACGSGRERARVFGSTRWDE